MPTAQCRRIRPNTARSAATLLSLICAGCSSVPELSVGPPGDAPMERVGNVAPFTGPRLGEEEHAGPALVERLSDQAAAEAAEAETLANAPGWLAFYDPSVVHEVRVTFTPEARAALQSDERSWVPAQVELDGRMFDAAGVHIKGNTTFQGLDRKPSLKIKLDEYGGSARIAGIQRLTLNNMVSDPAQAREVIATRLWWELGVPAPRASWARVWIDGEPYGLYSNLESMDDEWLKRRYTNSAGNFWEANDQADFTADGLEYWESAAGPGDPAVLEALVDALENGDDSIPFARRVADTVDLKSFLSYWATCLATGQSDGYPFHLNDAYAYSDPGDAGRLDFFPWSMDEAWGDSFGTWAEGELAVQCEDDEACSAALQTTIAGRITDLEALDVARFIDEAFAVSDPYLSQDPRRPYAMADVQAARAALAARVKGWPGTLRADLGL